MLFTKQFKKILFTVLSLFFFSNAYSQSNKDTVFLMKEKYSSIYITKDTTMRAYKWLIPEDPYEESLSFYRNYFNDAIKDTIITIKHYNDISLPHKWTPIYKIKKDYYLYGPSDWMFSFGYIIYDSTIIRQYSDGPDVMVILEHKKISKDKYYFKVLTNFKKIMELTIYIIDDQNNIAVWESTIDNEKYYELNVSSDNLTHFPMVNCDCREVKCLIEYEFKQPDYTKLIKNIP